MSTTRKYCRAGKHYAPPDDFVTAEGAALKSCVSCTSRRQDYLRQQRAYGKLLTQRAKEEAKLIAMGLPRRQARAARQAPGNDDRRAEELESG